MTSATGKLGPFGRRPHRRSWSVPAAVGGGVGGQDIAQSGSLAGSARATTALRSSVAAMRRCRRRPASSVSATGTAATAPGASASASSTRSMMSGVTNGRTASWISTRSGACSAPARARPLRTEACRVSSAVDGRSSCHDPSLRRPRRSGAASSPPPITTCTRSTPGCARNALQGARRAPDHRRCGRIAWARRRRRSVPRPPATISAAVFKLQPRLPTRLHYWAYRGRQDQQLRASAGFDAASHLRTRRAPLTLPKTSATRKTAYKMGKCASSAIPTATLPSIRIGRHMLAQQCAPGADVGRDRPAVPPTARIAWAPGWSSRRWWPASTWSTTATERATAQLAGILLPSSYNWRAARRAGWRKGRAWPRTGRRHHRHQHGLPGPRGHGQAVGLGADARPRPRRAA